MIRIFTISTLTASMLLGGCAAMDGLQKDMTSAAETVKTATTPSEVLAYKAFADRNDATMKAVARTVSTTGIKLIGSTANVTFTGGGRGFTVLVIKSLRIPVPAETIDAEAKELTPFFAALGGRMVEWNKTEPIELVAFAPTTEGADFMVAQLKRVAPAIHATPTVRPSSATDYAGIELRMLNSSAAPRPVK